MNLMDLNKYAHYLFKMMFDEDTNIEVKINKRLKRTLAWFVEDLVPYIEVSDRILNQDIYAVTDILCHELIHFYLYKNGKPNADDDIEFYALTYRNGISRTESTVFQNNIIKYEYFKHSVTCNCGYSINTYFQVIDNDFRPIIVCPECGNHLSYNYKKTEFLDYVPTFKVKMMADNYMKIK